MGKYVVQTFAGNGRPGLGDGSAATSASLAAPEKVLVSSSGLVYIADTDNNRVAAVDRIGVIRTVAGSVSAENQSLGNGGAATDAVVRFPHALYETGSGLYIGDHSYTVRLVSNSGVISNAAISNRAAFILPVGVAVDGLGRVYIADITHNQVLRAETDGSLTVVAGTGVAGTTGSGGPASTAQINAPSELRFDAQGRLLIGSAVAPLRQVDLSTGIITTPISNVMPHFDIEPTGSFVVARGNQVLRVNASTGAETLIAGATSPGFSGDGGSAINARFNGLQGIALTQTGSILVADTGNNRVREITSGGIVTTFAGGGPSVATLSSVMDSQGLAFDRAGHLYLTDFQYNYIREVLPDGTTKVVAGTGLAQNTGDGAAAANASFNHPSIIRFDAAGNLFFMDLNRGTGTVRKIAPGADGVITGAADETISTVAGRDADRSLADNGRADGGLGRNAVFVGARDFVFDSNGNLIIADWLDNRVRKVSPGADGVFNGGADELISTLAGNGGVGQSGDGTAALTAAVEAPLRLAIDAQDNLYVFVGNGSSQTAIRKIDAHTGVITTLVRGVNVADMIVDHAGRLFYTDGTAQVVEVNTASGARTLIAGSGQVGFGGDGGDALKALFRGASYLAVDASDSLVCISTTAISESGSSVLTEQSTTVSPPPSPTFCA